MTETRSIIVTGGASGIGEACVNLAIERGWSVTIADRNEAGEALAAAIRAQGGKAQFVPTDVGDEQSVKALVDEAVAAYGQLHGRSIRRGSSDAPGRSTRSTRPIGTGSTGSTFAACSCA